MFSRHFGDPKRRFGELKWRLYLKNLFMMEKYPVPSFDTIETLERGLHGIREGI